MEDVGPPNRPPERQEVTVNVSAVFVGFFILICLGWAVWKEWMIFAYLNASLLVVLSLGTYAIHRKYE
jgi:hypothetical protein